MTSTRVARAISRGPSPSPTSAETTAPSTAHTIAVSMSHPHEPARSRDGLDQRHRLAAAAGAAGSPRRRRLARAGDVALVSRNQLFADRLVGPGRRPTGRPARRRSPPGCAGAGVTRSTRARNCAASAAADVLDRAFHQIVQRREVIGRRGQGQSRPPGHRTVPDRIETTFTQQLGGSADQRIPSSLPLGVTARHAACCQQAVRRHGPFTESLTCGAHRVRRRFGLARGRWQDEPHAEPEPSRGPATRRRSRCRSRRGVHSRCVARFGDPPCRTRHRHDRGRRTPASTRSARAGLGRGGSPHDGHRIVRVGRAWRRADQLGDRPPAGPDRPLRPVIALHGKGSDAATVMAGGVEQGLAQAVNAGLPPFAVVAVDGGGSYWHKRASGEDSGAIVLDELIPMLSDKGLDTSRVAFIGWSMGGYGALLLGARLGPARTAAITAAARRCGCRRERLRPARSTAPATSPATACSACRRWRRSRSASTAATATRSTPPPNSSSPSFRIHRQVASPPAATTAATGVRSCPARSPGWHRC